MIEPDEFQSFPDNRVLADLPLGVYAAMENAETSYIRTLLDGIGVKIAEDVAGLGCTGLARKGVKTSAMVAIRAALAGTGVVLPCFVGRDRYCLVHDTIGGLQEKQEQLHAEHVDKVSRELTKEERKHVEVVESARRVKARTTAERASAAQELLREKDVGEEERFEDGDELRNGEYDRPRSKAVMDFGSEPQTWKCPEHDKTLWSCRYCVAQAIVEGPLVVELVAGFDDSSGPLFVDIAPANVEDLVEKSARETFSLFARVARWTRRLARE